MIGYKRHSRGLWRQDWRYVWYWRSTKQISKFGTKDSRLFYFYKNKVMIPTISDWNWNKIVSEQVKKWYKFYLYLVWAEYRRMIWHFKWWILYLSRKPEHLFVKTNSYGFNDQLIRKLDPETIVIISEKWVKSRLKTNVKQILEQWEYLFFLAQWFEKQIFLCRSLFEIIQ